MRGAGERRVRPEVCKDDFARHVREILPRAIQSPGLTRHRVA